MRVTLRSDPDRIPDPASDYEEHINSSSRNLSVR